MVVEYVFIFCTRRDVQDGVIDRRQEAGMRVSERGQITIPKEIREQFGFGPDTDVDIVVREGAVQIVHKPQIRAARIRDIYGRKSFGRTTNEIMSLLRT
jgi:antitoxin PrlF